jgi:hypothetical protein
MPILGMVLLFATGAVIGGLVSLMVIEARWPQRSADLIVGTLVLVFAVVLLGVSLPF